MKRSYVSVCYLNGEGVQVIEHHMVGLWKQRRVTLRGEIHKRNLTKFAVGVTGWVFD